MKDALIESYLFFNGRCEEALEFYRAAIGAKVEYMMRYNETPEPMPPEMVPPGFEKKICHATITIGQSKLMAADTCQPDTKFDGFSLSLAVKTKADAESAFNTLAVGGAVKMPLTKTFWSPCFGVLTDKFGVEWMVSVRT